MSKEMSLVVLGVWVAVVPYLGVPNSWRTIFVFLSGVAIAIIGLLLRGEELARGERNNANHGFVENTPLPNVEPTPSSHESAQSQ
jgi:hypothetical protein